MKPKSIIAITFLSIILSCNSQTNNLQSAKELFVKNNLNGTFVLYNLSSEKIKIYNDARADSIFIPASTFKILNSLMALENNVISNENEIIKWDGKDKGWKKWNKDQNMQTAISSSCIWFYQELARRIGKERMQNGISLSNYGNKKMGAKIDNFWLKGDLRISAKEQINFIKKLIKNELPFTKNNQ
ncbi:MAG: class D beta-lactamase, partial [Chlorobi bacterium]|nr:class D beta-lactamase [Chlorobiota bacterium]